MERIILLELKYLETEGISAQTFSERNVNIYFTLLILGEFILKFQDFRI